MNSSPQDSGTVKKVLDSVHSLYTVGTKKTHHVVIGDQKIFADLHKSMHQYGQDLDWVLPYPGDWYMLKNMQPVLLKLYYHAGLKALAVAARRRGANLTALQNASSFQHTHRFLLEAFEAMCIKAIEFINTCAAAEELTGSAFEKLQPLAVDHPTARLWCNFIADTGHYLKLWLAIRTCNWPLRVHTIKSLTPLYHALDRHNYVRLLAMHLADIQQYPPSIVDHFQQGAFSVSMKWNTRPQSST